jgi:hypothetical protein
LKPDFALAKNPCNGQNRKEFHVKPIRLDDVGAMPAAFLARLMPLEHLFRQHEYIDSLMQDPRAGRLQYDLEDYLRTQPVRGYHCTREPMPGYFSNHGLRLTDIASHQAEFLSQWGHLFTDSEKEDMRRARNSYFVGTGQERARNGMLWFCLTECSARAYGTRVFFDYFGGEAVFMPLKDHPTVALKLGQIGTPVVVEARLQPGTTAPLRLALPLLSAYHRTVRPDAHVWEAETNIRRPVPPADVLAVSRLVRA